MTQAPARVLAVDGLVVRYGPVVAVQDAALHVDRGEVVALLGPNGAGKTSLLSAVAGLVPVAAGQVELLGEQVAGQPAEALVTRGLALSPEGRRVFAGLSVEQNLRLGAATVRDAGVRGEREERMYGLFPILRERRRQAAGTLSGGQQQMVAIARALMSAPRLLLLDEPSLGLAPLVVEQIFELVAGLRDDGVTVLIVEQNVRRTLEIADRAYVLVNGAVASHGTAEELLSGGELERTYLGLEGAA